MSQLETLKLTYDRVREESKRLRDARGHFARGLGPAPASAGIATAVAAALGHDQNRGYLYAALGLLLLMIVVGMLYAGKPAYRLLYSRRVKANPELHPRQLAQLHPEEWYERMIELELSLYGEDLEQHNRLLLPHEEVRDLQAGLDAERTGALAVQLLWVAAMACLVLSQVA